MDGRTPLSRREALLCLGAAGAACVACVGPRTNDPPDAPRTGDGDLDLVARNDAAVRDLLARQIVDPRSPNRGSSPDQYGFCTAHAAASLVEAGAAALVHPRSRFAGDQDLLARLALAAGFLERAQSPRGNVDLVVTNFDSPPDTAFCVHGVATAAAIGRRHGRPELAELLRPFLVKAGQGMAQGGVHTPNHRWVVCAALAQVHGLFPDERLVRRIDEWLAEGIDIDGDGQFTERSTLVYSPIVDRSLVVVAELLGRPALLEPVRANLRALVFLLHGDGEVVTEISRRQDQNTRGGVAPYWFPATMLALRDGDGEFAALARMAAAGARLPALLEYPALSAPLPAAVPLPADYVREFPETGIVRLRRGPVSATVLLREASRLLTLRSGDAVLEGLRMASAFFGKGQFVPASGAWKDGVCTMQQELEAPYWQPLAEQVTPASWVASKSRRRQSELCRLQQWAEVREVAGGLQLRLRAHGTNGVPVAVELCFREGGELVGCREVEGSPGRWICDGEAGEYRVGRSVLRFGPGAAPHRYVQVRGAETKLPGVGVYVTGFTPFDHTLVITGG